MSYSFNGSAVALGAVLKAGGVTTVIPSQASVALAPTGGLGYSLAGSFSQNGISFSSAGSRVYGSESDGVYMTEIETWVTDLSIKNRLRIALMKATISSKHDLNLGESSFRVQTTYGGIEVNDGQVIPEYDVALSEAPTYDDVRNTLLGDIDGYSERWRLSAERLETAVANRNPQDPIGGSLIRNLHAPEAVAKHGHVIRIPGVGPAHFGEFLFKPGRRRVSLLRIELGAFTGFSDDGVLAAMSGDAVLMADDDGQTGGLTVCSLEGNGTPPVGG